jgi:serine protease Do
MKGVTMQAYIRTSILLLPWLLGVAQAGAVQNWSADQPGQPWVYSSEDGGTNSYLGVDIADVTSDRLAVLKLKDEKGVEITMVDQDAPAGKAGLMEHDVILSMNGTAVDSKAQLQRMIHETPPGRIVTLGLSRDGQPMTVKLQLADKHKEFAMAGPNVRVNIPEIHVPDIDIPSINMVMVTTSARSGLMVENITPQLGEFFGVKNGNGVLVRSVEKGSRAERAGFRAGDVIVKVNEQAIHDTNDFAHAVKSRSGDTVGISVMRDRKEQNLNLSLPERKDSGDLFPVDSFFSEPAFEAQQEQELSRLRDYLAELEPQAELVVENSRQAAQDLREQMCQRQRDFRKQAEKQKQQVEKSLQDLRRQLRLRLHDDWL